MMEKNFNISDDHLVLHALGLLSAGEARQMDAFLKNSPSWQQKFTAIQQENELVSAMPFEVPDAGFSEKLLQAWALENPKLAAAPPVLAKKGPKNWIVRSIFSFFGLTVLGSIFILFFSVSGQPVANDLKVPLPSFDFEKWFAQPALPFAILFVLTLVGLQFLEKLVQTRQFLKFQNR